MKIIQGERIIDSTPEIIAEALSNINSSEQARFFNEIAKISSTWNGGYFELQLQCITDEKGLELAGRRVMQAIGEYSHLGRCLNE